MVRKRSCTAVMAGGAQCRAAPLLERDWCFMHDPEQAESAAEARRVGGQRRKREGTLSGAYGFSGLNGPEDATRLLEIAAYDALALETSAGRVRLLVAVATASIRGFEVTDLAQRLAELERALGPRMKDRE